MEFLISIYRNISKYVQINSNVARVTLIRIAPRIQLDGEHTFYVWSTMWNGQDHLICADVPGWPSRAKGLVNWASAS